jgi:hypothetical protein
MAVLPDVMAEAPVAVISLALVYEVEALSAATLAIWVVFRIWHYQAPLF